MFDAFEFMSEEEAHRQMHMERQRRRLEKEFYLARIKDHYKDFMVKHYFSPGEVVRSKPGFDALWPLTDGYPAIILEIFEPFRLRRLETGVWDEGMLVDCTLLVLAADKAVHCAWDTRKLEPYPEDTKQDVDNVVCLNHPAKEAA